MEGRSLQSCENQVVKRRRKTSPPTTTTTIQEERNWLDLPRDVLLLIFMKLGAVEILVNAQRVCRWWWQLSKDPSLYRCVVIQGATKYMECFSSNRNMRMLAKEAVDRSCGQLVKFHCHDPVGTFNDMYFFKYLIDQKFPLKSLAIVYNITMPIDDLRPLMERFPLLEALHLQLDFYTQDLLETIGTSCPNLKYLHLQSLSHYGGCASFMDPHVSAVMGIAENMPQLRGLRLINGLLINKCLSAILVGCPLLEYLDLTGCCNLRLLGTLLRQQCLSRITTVILPNGSTYINGTSTGSKLSDSVMHSGDGLLA